MTPDKVFLNKSNKGLRCIKSHSFLYQKIFTFVYVMIFLENTKIYTLAATVMSIANENHGYKIKSVIKAKIKYDRSSSISHNALLI